MLRFDLAHGSLLRSKLFWKELFLIIVAIDRGPQEGSKNVY
jgi:hypothetical protein